MFHKLPHPNTSFRKQRGSGIMMAVFIILFFTAMAAAIVKLQTASSDSVVVEVYSARALMAANSAAGAKLSEIFPISGAGSCSNTPNLGFSGAGLENCSAAITCNSITDPASGITIYRVQSSGSCLFDNDTRSTARTVMIEARGI